MQGTVIKNQNCDGCPIRHRAVCASCETDELLQLERIKYYKTFEAGQPIMWGAENMHFVASIVSGTATIEHLTEDGRRQTVGLLLPSDFIGRPGRETAIYNVTAVTNVTLCCFRRKQFEELLDVTPHLTDRLLKMSLDELDAARDWMVLLGRKTAREKIASFLMLIVRRTQAPELQTLDKSHVIELPLTRSEMSDYLALTIETVSRQFSQLKSDGLIQLEGKRQVVIPDVPALRAEVMLG